MTEKYASLLTSVKNVFTWIWWHVPLSRENKEKVKSFVFLLLPFLFRNSRVYRNWHEALIFSQQRSGSGEIRQPVRCIEDHLCSNDELKYQPEPAPIEPVSEVAIVIHAYHFEIFPEILEYLRRIRRIPFRVFVTSPGILTEKIATMLESNAIQYELFTVENRGRDILPFLEMMPHVFNLGYSVILKIHTKKSDHHMAGHLWRNDLYKKLLTEAAMTQVLRLFNADHTIGIIGAPGHIVPMNLYYGANSKRIESLGMAMGVHPLHLQDLNFPAGSMFYARKQALMPLLNLNITTGDFEEENGQKDGTMAHVVERAFAVSALAAKLKLVDIKYNLLGSQATITKNHPFVH